MPNGTEFAKRFRIGNRNRKKTTSGCFQKFIRIEKIKTDPSIKPTCGLILKVINNPKIKEAI